jgi:hypothetical protein
LATPRQRAALNNQWPTRLGLAHPGYRPKLDEYEQNIDNYASIPNTPRFGLRFIKNLPGTWDANLFEP